ncbi:uncharacterized protein BCR38DRAFT_461995 [Pseudomassariella vexata]|uniref:DUF3752 domain-containing protein n=1 Tax=Pseudomassariella vexata TaxID=1141098 RepID=A0A1Y2D8A0_9PEZI|nr:uncharacterized protein BCR38DRAFT_461995 [Pseudomassariella vexata]ORY55493.1 hypothetical protein BCR38DRAFT_461995 [Pseudomassariella vexata]
MSSIGPQLPPHLKKRKRTPVDDTSADFPSSKLQACDGAHANKNEVALDGDSSGDDYGPPDPKEATKMGPSIGPILPPTSGAKEDRQPRTAAPTTKPSIGPTLPPLNTAEITLEDATPAPLFERPPNPPSESDSDSSDDDDYGPALPTSSSHQARQSQASAAAALSAATSKAPQRDDWMVVPPTSTGYQAPDPTKLKARKFNSGPRGGGTAAVPGGEISSIWTETPEQKRKRLENAVLGRADPSTEPPPGQTTTTGSGAVVSRLTGEEEQRAAKIRKNLEAARGRSLYEEHQQREGGKGGRIEEEEDDPSKRAFDREKDMKLGGKIGTAQRRELLTKAADFGGRFSKGKFL